MKINNFSPQVSHLWLVRNRMNSDSFVLSSSCDWQKKVGWPRLSLLHCKFVEDYRTVALVKTQTGIIWSRVQCTNHKAIPPLRRDNRDLYPVGLMDSVHHSPIRKVKFLVKLWGKRPFVQSGHMVQNHTCWWANCTVELPKQRQVKVDWYKLLCFGSPTVQLVSQHACVIVWPDRANGLLLKVTIRFPKVFERVSRTCSSLNHVTLKPIR